MRAFTGLLIVLVVVVRAMLSRPPLQFSHQIGEVASRSGEPIVAGPTARGRACLCGVGVEVVLHPALFLQVLQGASQGFGVDGGGTGLRHGVQNLRVPQWPVSQGFQDGAIELAAQNGLDEFEFVRQRDSPPPIERATPKEEISLWSQTSVLLPDCDRRDRTSDVVFALVMATK